VKKARDAMQAAQKAFADQRDQVLTPKQRAKMAIQAGTRGPMGRDHRGPGGRDRPEHGEDQKN
jgi:hypothetical protein